MYKKHIFSFENLCLLSENINTVLPQYLTRLRVPKPEPIVEYHI